MTVISYVLAALAVIAMLLMVLCFIHPALSATRVWPIYAITGVASLFLWLITSLYFGVIHRHRTRPTYGLNTTTFSVANILMALISSALVFIGAHWAILFGAALLIIAAVGYQQIIISK